MAKPGNPNGERHVAKRAPTRLKSTANALVESERQLRELAALREGWDDPASQPISSAAQLEARSLLHDTSEYLSRAGSACAPTDILPLRSGGIQLDWDGSTLSLEVRIHADGSLRYLLIESKGNVETYDEQAHATHDDVLLALARVVAAESNAVVVRLSA